VTVFTAGSSILFRDHPLGLQGPAGAMSCAAFVSQEAFYGLHIAHLAEAVDSTQVLAAAGDETQQFPHLASV
jgi:hypothetical protein